MQTKDFLRYGMNPSVRHSPPPAHSSEACQAGRTVASSPGSPMIPFFVATPRISIILSLTLSQFATPLYTSTKKSKPTSTSRSPSTSLQEPTWSGLWNPKSVWTTYTGLLSRLKCWGQRTTSKATTCSPDSCAPFSFSFSRNANRDEFGIRTPTLHAFSPPTGPSHRLAPIQVRLLNKAAA